MEFTNKLIFRADGIRLQVKRKGKKVKVRILDLSEDFDGLNSEKFNLSINFRNTGIFNSGLGLCEATEYRGKFYSDKDAIEWVHDLFELGYSHEDN